MNIQLRHLGALALGLLLGLSACRSEAPDAPTTPTNSPAITSGQVVTLPVSITAVADEPTAQQARAMSFDIQGTSYGSHTGVIPKIKHEALKSFTSVIVLANKTDNKKYVGSATWTQKVENGKTTYVLDKMTAPDAVNLKTGEWYLMAATGGAEQKNAGNNLPTRIEVKADTDLRPVSQGNVHSMVVPFLTAWRKLTWDAKDGNAELADKSTLLTFKTPGVFVVLKQQNYMPMPVRVSRTITLESNGYATQGYFNLDGLATNALSDKLALTESDWVTTNPETEASKAGDLNFLRNDDYKDKLQHYQMSFKLLKDASETDDAYYHLGKRSGNTPTEGSKYYVLWLMQTHAVGRKNFFYASAEVEDATRTNPTTEVSTYTNQSDPSSWKPVLGSKYLIASFDPGFRNESPITAGKSYLLSLRTIRPFLPIESVWPVYDHSGYYLPRQYEVELMANTLKNRNSLYTFAGKVGLWRFPDVRELTALLRLPETKLNFEAYGRTTHREDVKDYHKSPNKSLWVFFNEQRPKEVLINGQVIKGIRYVYTMWPQNDPNRVYALIYSRLDNSSNIGYQVAVRMTWDQTPQTTWDSPAYQPKDLLIETYYIGPNYVNEANDGSAITYFCHPAFWEKVIAGSGGVISRRIPYNRTGQIYWTQPYGAIYAGVSDPKLNGGDENGLAYYDYDDSGSKQYNWTYIAPFGELQVGSNPTPTVAYLIPWMTRAAW